MFLTTQSPEETEKLGQKIAEACLVLPPVSGQALILNMEGDLGGGKTTLVRGIAQGLQITDPITSPTFILSRRYPINHSFFKNFYHFDLYRLNFNNRQSLHQIGFNEIISLPENFVVIEWSERLGKFRPPGLIINLEFKDQKRRNISIQGDPNRLSKIKSFIDGESS